MPATTLRLFARQRDFDTNTPQTIRVGEQVADLLRQSVPHGISGKEARALIDTVDRTGGRRTGDEQALLTFLARDAADGRSNTRAELESGNVVSIRVTRGKTGGAAVLKAAATDVTAPSPAQPRIDRAEMEERARRMWSPDAGVQERPVSASLGDYLRQIGAAGGAAQVGALRTEFLEAAAAYVNGELRRAESEGLDLPEGLAGHVVTPEDLVGGFAPLEDLADEWELRVYPSVDIVEIARDGETLGAAFEFRMAHDMNLSTWTLIWDAKAEAFTAKANTHDWPQTFELLV
jgi:hypothetical protein